MSVTKKLNYIDCCAPVTALHVYKHYLFSGSGNKLELWPIADLDAPWKSLASLRLSQPMSIHCIDTTLADDLLLVIVSGHRFLSIIKVLSDFPGSHNVKLEYLKECLDLEEYINAVKINCDYVYVVLMDNTLKIINMKTWEISYEIASPIRCIIYSALILAVDSSKNALIVSGTPFKTTSIWYYRDEKVTSISTLDYHEGAVFSIEYDYTSNLLFTASDDRCINIWSHIDCKVDDARTWSKSKFILLRQLYSHTARIFSLKTVHGYLVSCGENEEICIWSPYSGSLQYKTTNTEGSTLWCLSASRKKGIIYVGSNDSSVKRFSLKGKLALSERVSGRCGVSMPKFISYVHTPSTHSDPDILCVTDDGQCAVIYADNDKMVSDNLIFLGRSFASYCVGFLSDKDIFYCANRFGMVKVIKVSPLFKEQYSFKAHDGKILKCILINDTFLLTSAINGEIKLWKRENKIAEYRLQSCRHCWVQCGLMNNNRLIVGDASGNLSIFANQQATAFQSFRGIHDKHGITDLKFHPVFEQTLFSCGRDGNVIEYHWNGETLTKLRCVPIKTNFDWIEKIHFDRDNELTLIGFASKNFVVWRKIESTRLWTVNCGGGHRIWDYKIFGDSLNLCFYSNNRIHSLSRLFAPVEVADPFIKQKFHSSKINCSCLVNYDEPTSIIATGGEDCNIVLSEFNSSTKYFRKTESCKGHISAVRALASIKKPDGTILMISAGGQAQIIIWSIMLRTNHRMIVTQVYDNLQDEKMRRSLRSSQEQSNKPVSRFVTVNITESGPDTYLISLTCSDATIKVFILANDRLYPYKQADVCDYCPLALHRVNNTLITGSNDGYLRFWVIDREIKEIQPHDKATFEFSKLLRKLDLTVLNRTKSELASHMAGINSIDSKHIKDNIWLIMTTGDDALITASLLRIVDEKIELINQKRFGTVHSSQIAFVSILDDVSLVTCSIDQKLSIWNYSIKSDGSKIEMTMIQSRLISVADISSATILYSKQDRFVIITGVGIEILKISE